MSRPLHAVFTELLHDEAARQAYAADPAGALEGAGHSGLPDELVAEAVVSFADTAAPAVAEHLAPFVKAHGPVPESGTDPSEPDGLALLASAPAAGDAGDAEATELLDPAVAMDPTAIREPGAAVDDLDFGTGSEFTPAEAHPGGFDDALTEIPAADPETAAPAPGEDGPSLTPDPAFEVDETEPAEDLDAE